jgi:glucan 1,6-alpha-glucosidase
MLVVSNFTENTVPCTLLKEWQGGEVLICNYSEDGEEGMLRPYESAIYCCH